MAGLSFLSNIVISLKVVIDSFARYDNCKNYIEKETLKGQCQAKEIDKRKERRLAGKGFVNVQGGRKAAESALLQMAKRFGNTRLGNLTGLLDGAG